jgi:RimJ/RimL family protein N-acetyltransferase
VALLLTKKFSDLDFSSLLIKGDRISLRSLTLDYAADIFAEFNSDITRYMMPKPAETIKDTEFFITDSINAMKRNKDVVFAIVDNSNNQFLGCCGLHRRSHLDSGEIGIWLKKDAHGHKYGLEAITFLCSWALDQLDFNYFIYPVDKANIASRKIPETLGGEVYQENQETSQSGIILDEVVYKIPYAVLLNKLKGDRGDE